MLIVIIAVVTLCGSIYLVLATNLGARLGFLVTLTGLAGWMALMGIIWMIYGIGLKGPEPSWEAIPGRTVLQDTDALYQRRRVRARASTFPTVRPSPSRPSSSPTQFAAEGWVPSRGGRPGLRPGVGVGRASCSRRPTPSPPASSRPSTCSTPAASATRRSASFDLLGVPPPAALRRRRGRPARADAHRARPGPGRGR